MCLVSCNGINLTDVDFESNAPYATESELTEIKNSSDNYVNYKVSRSLAMLEMEDFNSVSSFSSKAVLSDTPVVIWANNTTPLYYEFHIIDNGEDVGYVTCNIDKTKGDPVVYISDEPQNYSKSDARSVANSKSKIYENCYPNYTVQSNARSVAIDDSLMTDDETFYAWLDTITEVEYVESETTREEVIADYEQRKKEEQERLAKLWELIDAAEQNLVDLTDEEILAIVDEDNNARSVVNSYTVNNTATNFTEFVMLEPYCSHKITKCDKLFYCVPSVIEFICKCYAYDKNLNKTEAEIDDVILKTLTNKGVIPIDPAINKSLESATDNGLTSFRSLFHNYDVLKGYMELNKLPIMSSRFEARKLSDLIGCEGGHCRCITGFAVNKEVQQKKFLWITWNDYKKAKYYYMWDNGYENHAGNNVIPPKGSDKVNLDHRFWELDGSWIYKGTRIVVKKVL